MFPLPPKAAAAKLTTATKSLRQHFRRRGGAAALLLLTLSCPATVAVAGPEQPAETKSAILRLTDNGHLPGTMQPSPAPSVLRWQSPFFSEPFEFPLAAVRTVHYPQPAELPKPAGEFCFELVGDDVIYGDLVAFSEGHFEVETSRFGRLFLLRNHIRRFYRWHGGNLIYLGPSGLDGWSETNSSPLWRDLGGIPTTDKSGASIFGDFGIPEKAVIEFHLSWQRKPDFSFALGVNGDPKSSDEAFRFEVWDNQLVAIGEAAREADVASVSRVGSSGGQLRLQAYLDQKARRLLLFSPTGDSIASLHLVSGKPRQETGLRLTNKNGTLRLESLRISQWDGAPPVEVEANRARIHRSNGSVVYGELSGFDRDAQTFTLRDQDTETSLRVGDVTDVFLSGESVDTKPQSAEKKAAERPTEVKISYYDGSRVTGVPSRMDGGSLSLEMSGIRDVLRLSMADCRSLVISAEEADASPRPDGRKGRLEMRQLRLEGQLVSGEGDDDVSCLRWLPSLSNNASSLLQSVSGRIVYREPKPIVKRINRKAKQKRRGFGSVFKRMMTGNVAKGGQNPQTRFLHLRSGDTIPGEIKRINEDGVVFESPISDTTFIPHEAIKAVELSGQRSLLDLKGQERDQLLTLPRLLRDAPPSHLICSRNADFLRGRILKMDHANLTIEVRLSTKVIPRARLAHLIWLHEDELGEEARNPQSDAPPVSRVQTVRANGNRLTFVAERLQDQTLFGNSAILGECKVDLTEVDQLLIGGSIEDAAANLVFHRWKLHHAKDPLFVQDTEGGEAPSGPSGIESPLVGEPAPDFTLGQLGGGKFQLSKQSGSVVVLDFWATWCGPCLKTMPLVDRVVEEFADQGVELVAVNLQEQAGQVTSMLERHDLSMKVALDRDGVVASRYAVTAIPQTVVINRDGIVTRLFVGGGDKLEEPLREAIEEAISGDAGLADPTSTN